MNKLLMQRMLVTGILGGGLHYILRDEYNDTVALGAVNGTTPTPIGGARIAVDTESKLSIGVGNLILSGGKTTKDNRDPMSYYPTVTRAPGVMFLTQYNLITGAGYNTYFGFASGLTSTPNGATVLVGGGYSLSTRTVVNGPIDNTVGAEEYQHAIVLRASGMFHFIRGGAYTNWTLLYPSNTENTATLYPGFYNYNGYGRIRYAKIPRVTWLPMPITSDSFARANGLLGVTDGKGNPENNGVTGFPWTANIGNWSITTNVVNASTLIDGMAIATVDVLTPNVWVTTALTRSSGSLGIVVRYVDANNYVICYHDGTSIKVDEVIAGTSTNLLTTANSYANRIMRVLCDGSLVRVVYNDVVFTDITLAGSLTGTKFGLYSTNTSNNHTQFVVWSRNGANYDQISKYFTSINTTDIMCVGDSKSNPVGSGAAWQTKLADNMTLSANGNMYYTYTAGHIAVSGGTMDTITTAFDAALPGITHDVKIALMNITVNDTGTLPDKNTWKAQYHHLIDSLVAKWPSIRIYLARVWMQGQDANCDTMDGWIDEIVTEYSANPNIKAGFDERVWFKPNVAVYSPIDGTHYINEPGSTAAALEWQAFIGY